MHKGPGKANSERQRAAAVLQLGMSEMLAGSNLIGFGHGQQLISPVELADEHHALRISSGRSGKLP
jgi:hypothetical protein